MILVHRPDWPGRVSSTADPALLNQAFTWESPGPELGSQNVWGWTQPSFQVIAFAGGVENAASDAGASLESGRVWMHHEFPQQLITHRTASRVLGGGQEGKREVTEKREGSRRTMDAADTAARCAQCRHLDQLLSVAVVGEPAMGSGVCRCLWRKAVPLLHVEIFCLQTSSCPRPR